MADLFTLDDSLFEVYRAGIDALIDQIGKNVKLIYPPKIEVCSNCFYDSIGRRSANVYRSGGPAPFINGSLCPLCGGQGKRKSSYTEIIKMLVEWNPQDYESYQIGIRDARAVCSTKCHAIDMPKITRAIAVIIDSDQEAFIRQRCHLLGKPSLRGLQTSSYCQAFWQLVDINAVEYVGPIDVTSGTKVSGFGMFITGGAATTGVAGSTDLYIHGQDDYADSIGLVIKGLSASSDSAKGFISGHDINSGSTQLFISGLMSDSDSTDLFIEGSITSFDSNSLFISGLITDSSSTDLFVSGYSTDTENAALFINGHNLNSGVLSLWTEGHVAKTGSTNLFISGLITDFDSTDLYIEGGTPGGNTEINGSTNLYVGGLRQYDTFIDTYQFSSGTTDQWTDSGDPTYEWTIYPGQPVFIGDSGGTSLFISGSQPSNSSTNLFVNGLQSSGDSTNLFVGGVGLYDTFIVDHTFDTETGWTDSGALVYEWEIYPQQTADSGDYLFILE